MAGVRLERVSKVYDNGWVAVADVDFEIADGELLVLVGPSGCGKSTLLRMIAGLEAITSGRLWIDDRVVNALAPKDRDIAMVFQSYALYPHLSVYENLAFGLRLRGMSPQEVAPRVAAAAQMLGLQEMLESRPRQLSGGQRQRVALGRALVRQPKVFLLDEPLSNLDAKLRQTMRVELARLHRRLGTTMIYVTHDQIEALTLGQRVAVMCDGRVQQIDTPTAVYQRPANLFVAAFIGSPAMNLFRGRLRGDPVPSLDLGSAVLPLPGLSLAAPGLAAFVGQDVVVGVRPEHLHLETQAVTEASLVGTLDLVESVGNEVFLNVNHTSTPLIARMPPQPLPMPGDAVRLGYRVEQLHFFDPLTERRIV
ncbi:MAG: sn-glycerol-3-phosphate ABC transporter ATP-binding protein UgpC [Xanthomonadaceae bacterium]|nr:sn-glycerol-3-phosphate ABC transporter ATP-binding protein UgpC [Xanthomonadaceae bacterium]